MKNNLCLSLVLIALLSFIIISGCGGSSNSINPASSITTPTPAGDFGYITVNIAWPQGNKNEKKCLITSENDGKTITASMPGDTEVVIVKIRDYNDKDDTTKLLDPNNATHRFEWDTIKEYDSDKIGPLPAIKVIVRAEAYKASSNEGPISVAEQEFQIKPGDPPPEIGDYNTVDLALGDYEIGLTPTSLGFSGNYNAVIDTTLSIEYPTPVGTPAPAPSSQPVGGRTIKFKVSEVRYTGPEPDVTVKPEDIILDPAELKLSEYGYGKVNVTSNIKPVEATIIAMLMNSDETDILSWNTCDVILTLPEAYIYLCYPAENLIRGYNQDGTLSITIPNIEEPHNIVLVDNIYTSSINGFNINSVTRTGTDKKVIEKEDYGSVSNGLTINAYNNFLCMGNGAKLATVNIATGAMHYDFYSDPNCSRIIDLGHNSRWGYFALYSDSRGQNFVTRITSGSCSWNYSVDITTKKIHCERWAGLEYVYLCDDYGIKIHDQVTFNRIREIALPGVLNVATDARYMYALCDDSKIKILSLEGSPISEFSVKPGATDMAVRAGGSVSSKQKGYYCPPPTPAPESYNRVFNSSNTP